MSDDKALKPLSDREKRFVDEYLIDLNASQAYIRAFHQEGVSASGVTGCQLIKRPHVAAAVERALAQRSRRTGVTADRVVRELARIAFADLTQVANIGPDGVTIKDPLDMDVETMFAMSEITQVVTTNGVQVKVKLFDKIKALEALAKHLGLNAPEKADINVQGQVGVITPALEDMVRGIAERIGRKP